MSDFDLNPYHLQRPEKIAWRQLPNVTDPLEALRSSSLKKFLRPIDQILSDQGIRIEYQPLTKDDYLAWLPYYQEKMRENNYDLMATPEWYDQKVAAGFTVEGMYFYQGQKMICSGIFTRKETQRATFAFKASDRIDLTNQDNSSIGAVIDFFFLREMMKAGVQRISGGRSRNAFGVVNSVGYLDYKLKFGYSPFIPDSVNFLTSVPLNEQGLVLFFAQRAGESMLTLFVVKPKDLQKNFDIKRFAGTLFNYEEILY